MLAVVPGLGHIYNRQYVKGIIIFLLMALYIGLSINIVIYGNQGGGVAGLFTLGTQAGRDNSLFFLVEGLVSLALLLIGLALWIWNIRDARRNGELIDKGFQTEDMRTQWKRATGKGFPYLIMAPGMVAMFLAVVFPILLTLLLSFTNYNIKHMPPQKLFGWVGLSNYLNIFAKSSWRNAFLNTLSWTIIWTLCATMLTIVMGIFTAVVVNQKEVKGKKFWRTIIILPWAIPAFISILMFSLFFNDSFGAMNQQVLPFLNKLLPFLHLSSVPWKTNALFTKIALILIQGWLGFPYIFVMTTSVLQSIPGDMYEAARIDGASRFAQFKSITLPWILSSTAPVLITQFTFNFSNFNIIYLFNNGGPAVAGQLSGGTDILVSWVYKMTTGSVNRDFSMGAAITIFFSLFVMIIALAQYVRTDSFKGGDA